MKIYTKIVIDIATDKIICEESYEYDGPVARCDMSPDIEVPGPTEEERKAAAEQAKQLEIQTRMLQEMERER